MVSTKREDKLTHDEIIEASVSALGVQNAQFLAQGGQKWVLTVEFAGTPAVLKIVAVPPGPSGAIVLERAHREVELLAEVDSPNVVKVLSDAIEIGMPVEAVAWVEEHLDGEDLTTLMSTPWADDEVAKLIRDIGSALEACHDLDVVHRDLSPGNVRRTASGMYVLMDPGLARHLQKVAITGLFQPGTVGFRSPEHVPGGDPSTASDIFALGILCFCASTGEFPIDPKGDEADYNRRLVTTQAPSLSVQKPTVQAELAAVIDKCLRRQPARRYLDGKELLDDALKRGVI